MTGDRLPRQASPSARTRRSARRRATVAPATRPPPTLEVPRRRCWKRHFVAQIGLPPLTARTPRTRIGQSARCQRFQSSGKPCTATTSTAVANATVEQVLHEGGSMGETPPSTRRRPGAIRSRRSPASLDHFGELGPIRVGAIPMRQVVRLVPEHHRLDHVAATSGSQTYTSWHGCSTMLKPQLRSIARVQLD